MKYTIEGFSQAKAIELNLDLADLLVLRWFVDFSNTDKMVKHIIDNKIYFWVKYDGLLKELPILGITKDGLYRRLKKMVEKGVFEHTTFKNHRGIFSMYRLGKAYEILVADDEEGTESIPKGVRNEIREGTESITEQKNNLLNNKSTKENKNSLSKDKEEQAPKTKTYKNYGEIYADPINSEIKVALEKYIKSLRAKHGYTPRTSTVAKFAETLRNFSSNNSELAMRVVNQSIDNGWRDLYKLKNRHSRDAVSKAFDRDNDTLVTDDGGKAVIY